MNVGFLAWPRKKEFQREAAPAKCQNKGGALLNNNEGVCARVLRFHF